jgi:TRAP-type C4-dicarboxylate transport system permease small subunit
MFSRALNRMFTLVGIMAGGFLVIIAILVVAQIVARLLGLQLPGVNQFAGYSLAATSFLGLAYSFRQGAHIRVTLITDLFPKSAQRWVLVFALAIALSVVGYLAYNTLSMIYWSWEFNEKSPGIISYPLWVPQVAMGVGMALFAIAIFEDLVLVLIGRKPNFEINQEVIEGMS